MDDLTKQPVATVTSDYSSALGTLQLIFELANRGLHPTDIKGMVNFMAWHFSKHTALTGGAAFDLFAELEAATKGKRGLLDGTTLRRPRALLGEPDYGTWVKEFAEDKVSCEHGYQGVTYGYTYKCGKTNNDGARHFAVVATKAHYGTWMVFYPKGALTPKSAHRPSNSHETNVHWYRGDWDDFCWRPQDGPASGFLAVDSPKWSIERICAATLLALRPTDANNPGTDPGTYRLVDWHTRDDRYVVQRIRTEDLDVSCMSVDASAKKRGIGKNGDAWHFVPSDLVRPHTSIWADMDIRNNSLPDDHAYKWLRDIFVGGTEDGSCTPLPMCSAGATRRWKTRMVRHLVDWEMWVGARLANDPNHVALKTRAALALAAEQGYDTNPVANLVTAALRNVTDKLRRERKLKRKRQPVAWQREPREV